MVIKELVESINPKYIVKWGSFALVAFFGMALYDTVTNDDIFLNESAKSLDVGNDVIELEEDI